MNRVFITGRGLITPLGTGLAANEQALREGRSGTVLMREWRARGLESHVAGAADEDPECPMLNKKTRRFTPANARMAIASVYQALQEANLTPEQIKEQPIAVIGGVAGSNYLELYHNAAGFIKSGKLRSVSPFIVPRVMPSSSVSNLSLIYGFRGESYDISSACSSSAHAILQGSRLIQSGQYDIVVCGGAEELNWIHALGFMAMRALSNKHNDCPSIASRPFDIDRDGFVIAEGAGWVVLESEASIRRRNSKPICEITGFGANSNCTDMVQPDAESTAEVMRIALKNAGLKAEDIAYVNTHGTATGIGDPEEMLAIKSVFGGNTAINSTKSMTGHMIGATGAAEAIFTSLMIEKNFICPSINLDNPEPDFAWADLVRSRRDNVKVTHALSNSFAFGGTNVCLILSSMER